MLLSATVAAGGAFLVGKLFLRQFIEDVISSSRKFRAIDEAISRRGFQVVRRVLCVCLRERVCVCDCECE